MKLSTKGRYAVMAMVDLATQNDGKPIALADVAERDRKPIFFVQTVLAQRCRPAWRRKGDQSNRDQ